MEEISMQTHNFKKFVNKEGEVTLSGLPPSTQVAIVVIEPDLSERQKFLRDFTRDFSQNHPFAKMSREEVLERLRQTREEVYDELYGNRYAN